MLAAVHLPVISNSSTSNETFERLCGVPLKGPFFGFRILIKSLIFCNGIRAFMLWLIVFHKFLFSYPCSSRVVALPLSRASSDCGDSTYYYFAITILHYCSKNNTVVVTLTENRPSIYLIESAITQLNWFLLKLKFCLAALLRMRNFL